MSEVQILGLQPEEQVPTQGGCSNLLFDKMSAETA